MTMSGKEALADRLYRPRSLPKEMDSMRVNPQSMRRGSKGQSVLLLLCGKP